MAGIHARLLLGQVNPGIFVATGCVVFVAGCLLLWLVPPWILSRRLGVPVSLLIILGMRLRRTPPRIVLTAAQKLQQSGIQCPLASIEWLYLQNKNRVFDVPDLVHFVQENKNLWEPSPPAETTPRQPKTEVEKTPDRAAPVEPLTSTSTRSAAEFVERAQELCWELDSDDDNFDEQWERVIADCTQAIQLDPSCAQAYIVRGDARCQKDPETALDDYSAAIRLDSEHTDAYLYRAHVYYLLEQYEEATADCDQAIRIAPHEAQGYHQRAECLEELEEFTRALADYSKAAELDPKETQHLFSRGLLNKQLQDYKQAIADFDACIRIDGKKSWYMSSRGEAYLRTGEYKLAVQDLSRAIKADPDRFYLYGSRAEAYRGLGDLKRASADETTAKRLEPSV